MDSGCAGSPAPRNDQSEFTRVGMTAIDSIVARLTQLHPKRIDLSLERMWRILAALGDPQRRLPPVIHVAGTNGKGSTIAFMRAILEAAGLAVHVYTSPHLVRFNERFRLGAEREGRVVSDEELADALGECERVNAGAPITVFEITTAAALLLFARRRADVLLLEVGMGGRLDATNVIDHPLACVITPVSFDHAEHLGDTLGKIATEKAGILKPAVPAIVAAQPREALAAIERVAARAKAPVKIAGEDWTATEERGRLVYQDAAGLLDLPAPKLYGSHNADGARAVANALADLEERVSRPLVLVIGMLSTKDCESFLQNFTGLARRVVAVPIPRQEKSFPAGVIADAARAVGIPAQSEGDFETALTAIGHFGLAPAPRILIAGSLYLAGAVLAAHGTPPA